MTDFETELKRTSLPTRENRLGSITGFAGDLNELADKSRCGTVRNRERCFSQSSTCLSGCALGGLLGIRDAIVVYHAPAGCCATASATNVLMRQLAVRIGEESHSALIGSDMNENDTVFGAADFIRTLVAKVSDSYKPTVIFLASSCVSGVIGEDIDSIASELGEELGLKIIPVHCEGFKSRIWASGFDIADHAVLSRIVQPPREKRPFINFKNFFESERPQITEIFAELGVGVQFLYANSTVAELERVSEALATVCVCGTLGTYLGNALEALYGVPYIRTINFLGVTGFETWMRKIGATIGKEKETEAYLAREGAKYLPKINAIKEEIAALKLRAVIGMGPGYTYEVARVLAEFGIEVVEAAAWHYDYRYDNGEPPPSLLHLRDDMGINPALIVADQQNFEVLNILNRYKPDLYFSRHPGSTVWAVKQGVQAIYVADEYMIFGYKGTLGFANAVLDAVRNRSFAQNLAAHIKLPYTDWWYRQQAAAMLVPEGVSAESVSAEAASAASESVSTERLAVGL